MNEPHGHRGHPTLDETLRASRLRPRLAAVVAMLQADHWFTEKEATAFIAGIAWEIGNNQHGESWTGLNAAMETTRNLMEGRGAKGWAITLITLALNEMKELL